MSSLQNFLTATQIGTSATDITTTAAGQVKFIGQLTFTNTSASPVLVTVYKVLTSATETSGSGGNWLVQRSVPPGKPWNVIQDVGNIVLAELQTLSATAATGSVVNGECGGVLES